MGFCLIRRVGSTDRAGCRILPREHACGAGWWFDLSFVGASFLLPPFFSFFFLALPTPCISFGLRPAHCLCFAWSLRWGAQVDQVDWDNIPVPEGATAVSAFEAASAQYAKSEFQLAAIEFIICLRIAEQDENKVLQARATANLASVFQMLKDEERAVRFGMSSADLFKSLDDKPKELRILTKILLSYIALKDYSNALVVGHRILRTTEDPMLKRLTEMRIETIKGAMAGSDKVSARPGEQSFASANSRRASTVAKVTAGEMPDISATPEIGGVGKTIRHERRVSLLPINTA